VTRALAFALLLFWPAWATAQSPGWADIMGEADRAWQGGQIADAERLYDAAIIKAESFGESDSRLAQSLTALGLFYCEQGCYSAAAPLLGRALSVTEKAVPPGDPSLVPALINLVDGWLQQGLASAAEPVFRRA
jgi:tetratricopeptide (TPR) repeat protein